MTMTTENNTNRTGIYVQESADVTTAGDGFFPKGNKSPVTNIKEQNQSEVIHNYPHSSGQSGMIKDQNRPIIIKSGGDTQDNPHNIERIHQDKPAMDKEIAAGSLNLIPLGKRGSEGSGGGPRRRRRFRIRVRDNIRPNIVGQYFTSPAIKAGATEAESSFSTEGIVRKKENLTKNFELQKGGFKYVRRRMGLSGYHIKRRKSSSSDSSSAIDPDCLSSTQGILTKKYKKEQHKIIDDKKLAHSDAKYPIEVQIINKSNPFREISKEYHPLLRNALETTVQDERVIGGHTIKLGPRYYLKKTLIVRCKNDETVRFLEDKIPLYNRLWQGADLCLCREIVFSKRYKVGVRLPNYDLTSEEFFKIIGKQNGFPSEYWSLMFKKSCAGFYALFGVDEASYERMQESNGFVHFLFDRIYINLK